MSVQSRKQHFVTYRMVQLINQPLKFLTLLRKRTLIFVCKTCQSNSGKWTPWLIRTGSLKVAKTKEEAQHGGLRGGGGGGFPLLSILGYHSTRNIQGVKVDFFQIFNFFLISILFSS